MATQPSRVTGEKIWLDGRFVPWADANVHVLTHTLHYGLGVFEGIRSYATADGRSADTPSGLCGSSSARPSTSSTVSTRCRLRRRSIAGGTSRRSRRMRWAAIRAR